MATTTLKEVRPTVVRGLSRLTQVSVGVMIPAKKESVRTGAGCTVGKVCSCTRLNDSVQYIGSR